MQLVISHCCLVHMYDDLLAMHILMESHGCLQNTKAACQNSNGAHGVRHCMHSVDCFCMCRCLRRSSWRCLQLLCVVTQLMGTSGLPGRCAMCLHG